DLLGRERPPGRGDRRRDRGAGTAPAGPQAGPARGRPRGSLGAAGLRRRRRARAACRGARLLLPRADLARLPGHRAARGGHGAGRRARGRRRAGVPLSQRRLVLWRHGRTAWNDDRRFQGQTDIELDEHGRRQARRTARVLATLPPSVLVSSDLVRARATVAELAVLTELPVAVDPRLRETYAGRWEGLLAHEIEAVDPVTWQAWQAGDAEVRPGGGETRAEVADRAVSAVSDALPQVADDGVLVVGTHGGTARALIGRLLGLPEREWHVLGG